MPSASAFTIDSSSLTFGKVLARGSAPGITVYQAELQLGKHSIQVCPQMTSQMADNLANHNKAVLQLQVAVKRLDTSQAEAAVKELFLEEINTVQFASATCHRTCRILGCCQLGDDICLVMNLYPQTAANLLANAKGQPSNVGVRRGSLCQHIKPSDASASPCCYRSLEPASCHCHGCRCA